MKLKSPENRQSRCFSARFTFHTDCEERCGDDEKHQPDNNKRGEKNTSETEYDWQMNGWRSSRLHARSQIKKFNIFRYPFYTCCVALVVDACQLLFERVWGAERKWFGFVCVAWTSTLFSPCRSRCWLGCSFHACELFLCASFFDYFLLAPLDFRAAV